MGTLYHLDKSLEGGVERIIVLLDELVGLVTDGARKVTDKETVFIPEQKTTFTVVIE